MAINITGTAGSISGASGNLSLYSEPSNDATISYNLYTVDLAGVASSTSGASGSLTLYPVPSNDATVNYTLSDAWLGKMTTNIEMDLNTTFQSDGIMTFSSLDIPMYCTFQANGLYQSKGHTFELDIEVSSGVKMYLDWRDKLISYFDRTLSGNIARLLRIVSNEVADIKNNLDEIKVVRYIETAYGEHLDKIGENVQQNRGSLDDDLYTILIKGRIAKNISKGSVNEIINVMATMLNAKRSDIEVIENPGDEMASIKVEIALDVIGKTALTREQSLVVLHQIVAAGVRPYSLLSGTFYFSDGSVTTSDDGLGDIDDSSIGGTLGSIYEPEASDELPGW